ncbi:MAG: 50S ribosomal protein L13 [Candidatus Aenigmatarchaeota archaeon]
MIVNAENQVLGRLASELAQKLLDGEEIEVVNAEKAIITGKPEKTVEKYRKRKERGDPHHGPYYPGKPEAILRRTVRGMLPVKKSRGKKAFKRLKVHRGNPKDEDGEKISKDRKDVYTNYITLEDLAKRIGG